MKTTVMKPQRTNNIPEGNYIYELKYDGGSAIIEKNNNGVAIYHNDNGTNQIHKYPELQHDLSKLPNGTYIAELCCQSPEAVGGNFSNFLKRQCDNNFKIQRRANQYPITAMVYDITVLDKEDLTNLSLLERKEMLSESIGTTSRIHLVEYYDNPESIIELSMQQQIEGIVAKNVNKPYLFEKRDGWYKVRFNKEETVKCIAYETWSSSDKSLEGIVLTTEKGDRINLPGKRRLTAMQKIKDDGFVMVEVSKYGRRFPVAKRVL